MSIKQIKTKPGVYAIKKNIKIKVIVLCDNGTDFYPVIADAIIPKNAIIVHPFQSTKTNDQKKISNYLRTNIIRFIDINTQYEDDTVSFNKFLSHEVKSIIECVTVNVKYNTKIDKDINVEYGLGYLFSLDPDVINKDFEHAQFCCET